MKESIIRAKSLAFAKDIFRLSRRLIASKEYIIAKQLMRSGTSVGANVEEASVAQSRRDFLSKLSIALKEAQETKYWLTLLKEEKVCSIDYEPYIEAIIEIIKILNAITKTIRYKSNS